MSDMTLWDLAQQIRLYPNRDHALMVEQWAREKSKEWEGHYLAVIDCVADLGVPEGK